MLVLLAAVVSGAWATTPNSIVINGTPQVGDKSISLTYYFDPANVPGITSYAPTLKVKCAADNKWDEMNLSLTEVSSGTTNISLSTLGEFEAGKTYEVCFAYNNGAWVDDVFQSFVPAAAGYSVTLKDGVKDADKWTVKVGEGEAQALPIGGLKGDGSETVTLQYTGRLKVKGVKATSDAAPAANPNAYLKWDGTQKKLVATPMPESFTTVTSENTQWSAGTYVVEGQVDFTSTIELSGDVNLIIKDGAKLTVYHLNGNTHNLSIYGQAQMTGELDVNHSGGDAINEIPTLEVHSAKVTATSSSDYGAGFGDIGTFNVYGGSVDAKGTATDGGCGICLGENGSMNIYGGEVKAEGKGNDLDSYGITCAESLATTVKVYGGKLWAGCADNSALDNRGITLTKGDGFTGKIETSNDGSYWNELLPGDVLTTKYVRVGY